MCQISNGVVSARSDLTNTLSLTRCLESGGFSQTTMRHLHPTPTPLPQGLGQTLTGLNFQRGQQVIQSVYVPSPCSLQHTHTHTHTTWTSFTGESSEMPCKQPFHRKQSSLPSPVRLDPLARIPTERRPEPPRPLTFSRTALAVWYTSSRLPTSQMK